MFADSSTDVLFVSWVKCGQCHACVCVARRGRFLSEATVLEWSSAPELLQPPGLSSEQWRRAPTGGDSSPKKPPEEDLAATAMIQTNYTYFNTEAPALLFIYLFIFFTFGFLLILGSDRADIKFNKAKNLSLKCFLEWLSPSSSIKS